MWDKVLSVSVQDSMWSLHLGKVSEDSGTRPHSDYLTSSGYLKRLLCGLVRRISGPTEEPEEQTLEERQLVFLFLLSLAKISFRVIKAADLWWRKLRHGTLTPFEPERKVSVYVCD